MYVLSFFVTTYFNWYTTDPAVYPFNLQRIYPSTSISTAIISQEAPDPIPDSPLKIKVGSKIPCVYPSFDLCTASGFLCEKLISLAHNRPGCVSFQLERNIPRRRDAGRGVF